MTTEAEGDIAARAELLGQFKLFASLDAGSLQALAARCHMGRWAAGRLLFQRGDDGSYLLAITAGKLRLSIGSAQGRDLILRVAGAGEVVGELSLIDGQPRSADVTAVVDTAAVILPRGVILQLTVNRPDVAMALARHLCSIVRNRNYQMESIALFDLQSRVVRFILFALHQSYGAAIPEQPRLTLDMNQSDLSAILGASRPKVNHALKLLVADGILRKDGSMMICDRDRLQALAGSGGAAT